MVKKLKIVKPQDGPPELSNTEQIAHKALSTRSLILHGSVYSKLYETLEDKSSSGKERPWRDKKINSLKISRSFERLSDWRKFDLVSNCGNFLEFKRFSDDSLKLHFANFCRVRLCPMCSWRRSLKIFSQVSKVMNSALTENPDYRFVFLTLTVRNCSGEDLSNTLDVLLDGYDKLFDLRKIKGTKKNPSHILGAFRTLEITHNTNRSSFSFNTYHPHLHVLLLVDKSYFDLDGDFFINKLGKGGWVDMWGQCVKADYEPIIDIHAIRKRGNNDDYSSAVAEVSRYSVKDSDILNIDQHLQDQAVFYLDKALSGRRLISFRGKLGKLHRQLRLDDAVEGDLINTGLEDDLNSDLEYVLEKYRWHVGYNNYIKID